MNIQVRSEVIIVVVVLLLGYGFGKYGQPAKIVTKTNTVIQTVTVDHVNTVTVVKEVDKPDGTKEIDTTTTDKSQVNTDTDVHVETEKVVTESKAQWRVAAALVPQVSGGTFGPLYGLDVERRILGPIWAGVGADTNRQIALKVGFEF